MFLRRRVTAAACALAVTAGIAACGGSSSSTVSPTSYARSICKAVGPFEKDVAQRSSALNLTQIKNASEGKSALQGFLAAIASDTATAVTQLKAAGTPSVKNGQQIANALVQAFTRLKAALDTAAKSALQLPTGSATAFRAAADALGTSVKSSMSDIGASLSGLKSPELETAARKVPACQTLGG
jgi:hypothetical protein